MPNEVWKLRSALATCAAWAAALLVAASPAAAQEGVSPASIRIGMPTVTTGPNGAYGLEMVRGMKALFDSVNEVGGINGRKLELIVVDDGYVASRTVENVRKLITEDRVFAMVASYGAQAASAIKPLLDEAKIPLIGPLTGSTPAQANPGRYIFYTRAGYPDETRAIARHLRTLGVARFAVFKQSDPYGESGLQGMHKALGDLGAKLVAVGEVLPNSEADEQIKKAVDIVAAGNPQAVVIATLAKPVAKFIRGMRAKGIYPTYYLLSPVGHEVLVSELGVEHARGIGFSQVMPNPQLPTIPLVAEYQRIMRKHGDGRFSYYSLEAYVSGRLLLEGLRRSGIKPTRERLVSEIESMRSLDLGGFFLTFSPEKHVGSSFVELTIIGSNGQVVR